MNENSLKNLTYNHVPLAEDFVRREFSKRGYEIIDYTYKNNLTRMCCYDSEGYKVMVSYESFSHNVKQYQRFSTICNEANFLYNANLYAQKNGMNCVVKEWRPSKTQNHINIICECACGNEYICDFNYWRSNLKSRCNKCVRQISGLELKTMNWLKEHNIEFVKEFRFEKCRNKRPLPFDFYLPQYNICIEVDGEQHYKETHLTHFRGGELPDNYFEERKRCDNIKTEYCKNHNIKLIRLSFMVFRSDKYKTILFNEIYNN